MSSVVEQWSDEVADRVLQRLRSSRLAIQPKRVQVAIETDAFEDDAWRVLLVLPAPSGETWDRASVFKARRAAIDVLDDLAAADGQGLPGRTIALVTTDEADVADTAPEEFPVPGEGTSG